MKKLILSFSLLFAFMGIQSMKAANDCDLDVQLIAPDPTATDSPEEVNQLLVTRLEQALHAAGFSAGDSYGQFYMSGRFVDSYKELLPGPPKQWAVTTQLTLYVADLGSNKSFASKTFELRGIGTSEQRAYMNALSQLSGKSEILKSFVKEAEGRVIDYFNRNYKSYLAKAQTAAAQGDYKQALYYSTLIPYCSTGWGEASNATLSYYQKDIDKDGAKLLMEAKSIFAANPNAYGAADAFSILSQIDPASSSYKAAVKFAEEMNKQAKSEYNFEVHEKYKDNLSKEKSMIQAAKEIGVAYGRGQKAQTTNILWR